MRNLTVVRLEVAPVAELLADPRLEGSLADDEVGKLVITYGQTNRQDCVSDVVMRILALTVMLFIKLIQAYQERKIPTGKLFGLFSVGRRIRLQDVEQATST